MLGHGVLDLGVLDLGGKTSLREKVTFLLFIEQMRLSIIGEKLGLPPDLFTRFLRVSRLFNTLTQG